ncbi:unnamed protein product [Prorocentrum cordatum]|uniref:Uncharacterized protein n=1 Tax=Prorocentrum cordatum TaxID=2364126 RepID=A0ABN9TBL8_9DINO|nr:unnamed protein product [Polarella glacialis]
MTGGLGYTGSPGYDGLMKRVQRGRVADLATFCEGLAELPLVAEPGRRYEYSFSTDVLGRVCEVVSGDQRGAQAGGVGVCVCGYLGPPEDPSADPKASATVADRSTEFKDILDGKAYDVLTMDVGFLNVGDAEYGVSPQDSLGSFVHSRCYPVALAIGAWWKDYARFCQMLLDGGVGPGRRRVLSEATVRLLWRDALAPYARADGRVPGWNEPGPGRRYWDHVGWSLLGAHVTFSDGPREDWAGALPARGRACSWAAAAAPIGASTRAAGSSRCLSRRASGAAGKGMRTARTDGHGPRGNDAAPFARAAADGSSVLLPHEYGRYGRPGIREEEVAVRIPLHDWAA